VTCANEARPLGRVQGALPYPRDVLRAGREGPFNEYLPLVLGSGRQEVGRVVAYRVSQRPRSSGRRQVGGGSARSEGDLIPMPPSAGGSVHWSQALSSSRTFSSSSVVSRSARS